MEKILKTQSDIIFNFQTQQIGRTWGKAKKGSKENESKLTILFGDDSWKKAKKRNDLLEIYKDRIRKANKECIDSIEISSRNPSFHYNLIFATKKTSTGSKWFNSIINHLHNTIEKNRAETIKVAFDVIEGKTKTLASTF